MTTSSITDGDRMAVLIVEDDPDMRSVLRDYLERDGFAVIEEVSADRAVSLVETRSFGAAIIDKEIPGMSGLDFVSFLRHRHPDLPVIVVTAFGGPAVAEEAFARGASRYLEKPFRISDLVLALRVVTREAKPT